MTIRWRWCILVEEIYGLEVFQWISLVLHLPVRKRESFSPTERDSENAIGIEDSGFRKRLLPPILQGSGRIFLEEMKSESFKLSWTLP